MLHKLSVFFPIACLQSQNVTMGEFMVDVISELFYEEAGSIRVKCLQLSLFVLF